MVVVNGSDQLIIEAIEATRDGLYLQALTDGAHGAQVVDGSRRYELVLRLPDASRSPQDLARTLIDTPSGRIPVAAIATVEETDGPNQIGRENGRVRHMFVT